MNEYIEASNEAKSAEEKIAALEEELESGKQSVEEWLAAADSLYGQTSEEADGATSDVEKLNAALNDLPIEKIIKITIQQAMDGFFPHAIGSAYIPYDNYPALLHRGEKVLTATEARRNSESVDYAVIGEMIAGSVENAMSKVYVMLNGDKVGDLTTKRVRNNVNAQSYSRLRALGG